MRSPSTLIALLAALATLPATPSSAAVGTGAGAAARKLNFDVFLDDRAIGYQRFELSPAGEGVRIDTRAEFEVKLLRITAFAYEHRNTEVWRGDCLQTIESRTDSNGKQYSVSGEARGAAFVVATRDGERRLDTCVASFAYWDKDVLLQQRRMLNSQTGEYLPVKIDALGRDSVRIGGREVPVERFALKGPELDITLAYAAGGREWIALDSRLENGRTLRYRRSAAELQGPSVPRPPRAGGGTGAGG